MEKRDDFYGMIDRLLVWLDCWGLNKVEKYNVVLVFCMIY